MITLPSFEPIFTIPDFWRAVPVFHGRDRQFWLAATSGAWFRIDERTLARVEAPFEIPSDMTLEALDWDASANKLLGVAVGTARNQTAILVEGAAAVVVEGPPRMAERSRKFLFTTTGLVMVTWKELPGAWDAYRLDRESVAWDSLGETVPFARCTLTAAEDRTRPGHLVVLEQRSGSVAIFDGHAWNAFDDRQVDVRAMVTDPGTGRVMIFDDDVVNCAQRLLADRWESVPFRVDGAQSVESFGIRDGSTAVSGTDVFFRGGRLKGRPETVGAVWRGADSLVTSWGPRCLSSDDGLHVDGDIAAFANEGTPVTPYIRLTDGALLETRADAGEHAIVDAAEGVTRLTTPLVTEARTGARIAATDTGLVTIDARGNRTKTRHAVDFTGIVALVGGGVFLAGCIRGREGLRYAYFDGTALYDIAIDPAARPAGLVEVKTYYEAFIDVFVDSATGHLLVGFDDGGVGAWSAYLGDGRWIPVATGEGSTSTDDRRVVWDDQRRQLIRSHATIDGVPMLGVFGTPFGPILDALKPPVVGRFDVKAMKKPIVVCAAAKATKPAATQPAKKPVAKKPVAKKPVAKKPVAKKKK